MQKNKSNKGQLGIESIRIGGMEVDGLPMAECADAKQQLPKSRETDRQNKIAHIKASYPKQSIAWIKGAIRECEVTIKNIQGLSTDQSTMINEYTAHITLCEFRDKSITKLEEKGGDEKELKETIKELKLQFPPYNVSAMKTQIILCNEAIERCNDVINKEHKSISELRELKSKCLQRDKEFQLLDAK